MQLSGFHHLTAVTAKATENLHFYTQTLGLRLVKKTVNQDDTSSYHLFYADGAATPGSDITFFDWPAVRERRGSHSVVRTGFRVAPSSIGYWAQRLADLKVTHAPVSTRDGRPVIEFEDFEGQRLAIVADETNTEAHPWERSPVAAEHQILGLGSITMSVADIMPTDAVLTSVMNMKAVRKYTAAVSDGSAGGSDGSAGESEVYVYSMGDGGPAAELHVAIEPKLGRSRYGAGGVHHVAFRVPTFEEYDLWNTRLTEMGMQSSGPVNRFYFRSLYFREPGGTLFELATDQPGFSADEPMESLGEQLSLPPFLEPRRKEIEAGLKPIG